MLNSKKNRRLMHSRWHYGVPAILLHWLMAILVSALAGLGWYMLSIEDKPGSGWYFDLHKSIGLVVFALVVMRWIWRTGHQPGPLPASVSVLQSRVAVLTHWLLYACLFLMPVTGMAGAALSDKGLIFFGTRLPRLVTPNHNLSERFFDLHGIVIWVLVGLIAIHVLASLKHLLIDKDGVFQRMWF